jgi:hypothetical protein
MKRLEAYYIYVQNVSTEYVSVEPVFTRVNVLHGRSVFLLAAWSPPGKVRYKFLADFARVILYQASDVFETCCDGE